MADNRTIKHPLQPLVSVVLCTFNGEKYLQPQLASLAAQTYTNLEIVCSDNNSSDYTAAILTAWCADHPNRHLFSCAEPGLNKNFFSAITKTNGEYIFFCDQDDIWHPEKIEKLMIFHLQNEHASMVYCLSKSFEGNEPDNFNCKHHQLPLEGNNVRQTLLSCFVLGHNICIRKSILDKIPVPQNETIAFDWWIEVSAMCLGEIKCLPGSLTLWRRHSSNSTIELRKGLVYQLRLKALRQFLTNSLISQQDKQWINEAIEKYQELDTKESSFPLFVFLMKNASVIFFYKKKKNPILKWISYTKWCIRLSKKKYSVG